MTRQEILNTERKLIQKQESISITKEELQRRLPKNTSHVVTDRIIELISNMENDIDLPQSFMEEKVLSGLHLLGGSGTLTLDGYLNAVKYVHLTRFMTNKEAYSIVFRKKYEERVESGKSVDQYVGAFNTTDTVKELRNMMVISPSLEYHHVFREMVDRGTNIARGISANGSPVSANVQANMIGKMLEVLAPEKDSTIDIKVGMSDDAMSVQQGIFDQLSKLSASQASDAKAGKSITEIQQIGLVVEPVIEAEIE